MDLKLNIQSASLKGLMSKDQCLELARKIMKLYDSDANNLMEVNDAGNLQNDCYKALNIQFSPSTNDVNGYAKIFNSNDKAKISVSDIERLCFKYFGGYTTEPPVQQKQPETVDLSPIQNDEQPPTPGKYQYQSPYRRYASQKSTQGSQSSIQINNQQAVKSQIVEVTQKKEQPKYNRMAEARLQVARRIFKMLDQECNGYITEKHVTPLLIETYKDLGMTIEPTQEDVQMWMEMTDLDRDGKVYLSDYEAFVLKSLQSQGIQID